MYCQVSPVEKDKLLDVALIKQLKEEVSNDKGLIVNLTNGVTKLEKDNAQKDARAKDLEKVDVKACDRLDQLERKSFELGFMMSNNKGPTI